MALAVLVCRPTGRKARHHRGHPGTGRISDHLPVVDVGGIRHRVPLDAVTEGQRAGRYRAVCGDVVLPASLTAPARVECLDCERMVTG